VCYNVVASFADSTFRQWIGSLTNLVLTEGCWTRGISYLSGEVTVCEVAAMKCDWLPLVIMQSFTVELYQLL